MGIGDTLRWDLDKIVMREAEDEAKIACGNLQMCAGLEAGIEGATHAVGQMRLERVKAIWHIGEEDGVSIEEKDSGVVVACLNNLTIETSGTEE